MVRSALAVHGEERIGRSLEAAARLREGLAAAGRFPELRERILGSPDVVAHDPLRVVVDTRAGGIGGHEARSVLFHEHDVHVEMATDSAVVAMLGAGSVPDVEHTLAAFASLPERGAADVGPLSLPTPGPAVMSLREAYFAPSEAVPATEAVGRISAKESLGECRAVVGVLPLGAQDGDGASASPRVRPIRAELDDRSRALS